MWSITGSECQTGETIFFFGERDQQGRGKMKREINKSESEVEKGESLNTFYKDLRIKISFMWVEELTYHLVTWTEERN